MNLSGLQKLDNLDFRIPDWKPFPTERRTCPFCGEYADPLFLRPDNLPVSQCSQCLCFYVSLKISEKSLQEFYNHYWSVTCPRPLTDEMARYLSASVQKRAAADHTLQKLGALSGTWKDKKVLDVGCGFGEKATMMGALGASVIGLDISEEALNFVKEKLGITSYHSTIEALGGQDKHFDMVTMFEFIEHPLEPLCSIEAAVEKLKPNGLLAIVTPNGTAGERWIQGQGDWVGFRTEMEHMQYLHVETIAWLAKRFDCRIVHLEQFGFRPSGNIFSVRKSVSLTVQQQLRRFIKNIPGVRGFIFALYDLKSRLQSARTPPRDTGVYHLFTVLKKKG